MESQQKKQRFLVGIAFWAVILALIYVFFKYFLHLVMPFFIALLFAMLMRPLVRLLSNRLHLPKGFSGVVTTVLFYLIIGSLLVLLFLRIVSRIGDLFALLPALYEDTLEPGLVNLFNRLEGLAAQYNLSIEEALQSAGPQILSAAGNAVTSISGTVVGWVTSLATKLPGFIVGLVICVVATFFMSADYDRMTGVLVNLFPEKGQSVLRDVRRSLGKVARQYGRSYLLILCITFAELLLGLSILRVKNFVIIALIIAILDIFPVLGTGTVLIPWAVICFIQGRVGRGIGLLVVYVIITVIRQVIEPKIVGKHVGLHPLITLICMFVGTNLFGVVGLFGLPIMMAIILELNNSGTIRIFRTAADRVQAQPLDARAQGQTPPDAAQDSPDGK